LLARLAPPYSLNLFSLSFFPGPSLYSKAIKKNIIDEKTKLDHYLNYKPTYLNLIIALFGLCKLSEWVLKLLLSKRLVNTKRNFPILHRIIYNLIFYRRGIYSLATRDYSMFPARLQILLCKILPPRTPDWEMIYRGPNPTERQGTRNRKATVPQLTLDGLRFIFRVFIDRIVKLWESPRHSRGFTYN